MVLISPTAFDVKLQRLHNNLMQGERDTEKNSISSFDSLVHLRCRGSSQPPQTTKAPAALVKQ